MELSRVTLVSELPIGTKFKLKGRDAIFERIKRPAIGEIVYIRKGLEDLVYCANMEVKEIIS